ncbi:unnamed protein product [Pseudo-nitzschia multistriata]|uniref:DNA (cytosine-5-)-methyltransferase n=1 Tax=Pseudo-nitzschia multistriata TaxID=183589 RepID=A0A448YZ43_9STRA|nr:unnamed protein product [Pseudo-nitzschia multistriata]
MERFKNSQRRELRMLEFFAGKAVVSEALHNYGSYWRTRSIDKDPNSRATDKIDFMKVRWKNIGKLPDFIWITLPCFTHSFLARGDNRSTKENWFAKAPEALWQDRFLARMSWFLEWVKKKNDHVIFVIENPTGWMGEMAMIKTIVGKMEMRRTTVDYCVSGGSDKVSTNLWTNDSKLHAALSMFSKSSPESCSHHGRPYPHHPRYKPAEISRDLAETVAESVSARFGVNDLKVCYKAEPEVSTEEITFFNKMMGGAD